MINIRQIGNKRILIAVAILLVVLMYGYNLNFPSEPYFDEEHYVKFAREVIDSNEYNQYATQHPPLFHFLMVGGMKVFGDVSYVWRIVPFLAGLGVLMMVFFVAKRITKDSVIAFFAVFLSVFDCISLTQARIAMMNSLMLFFILLALWFFLKAFESEERVDKKALRNTGICWGLALSSKLVSINLVLFFLVLACIELYKRKVNVRMILPCFLYFCVIPIIIFFATHLFIPLMKDRSFMDIWNIFMFNVKYHAEMRQGHPYESKWWSWPFMLRPVWYYFKVFDWNTPQATMRGIFVIGNPAIFWMIPLAIANTILGFLKKGARGKGLILLGFVISWLIFAGSKRMHLFHYFYLAMPFVVMSIAVLMAEIWRAHRTGKVIVIMYALLVVAMFIYWYPLLTGIPISSSYYMDHMWFKAWI